MIAAIAGWWNISSENKNKIKSKCFPFKQILDKFATITTTIMITITTYAHMRKAVLILMNRVKNLVVKINEVWLVRGKGRRGRENEKDCVHDGSRPVED